MKITILQLDVVVCVGLQCHEGFDMKLFISILFFAHRLGYARISHGGLSDTEIQVGRFHIPDNPSNAVDHNRIVKDPSEIDEDIRFSSRYHLSTDLQLP